MKRIIIICVLILIPSLVYTGYGKGGVEEAVYSVVTTIALILLLIYTILESVHDKIVKIGLVHMMQTQPDIVAATIRDLKNKESKNNPAD